MVGLARAVPLFELRAALDFLSQLEVLPRYFEIVQRVLLHVRIARHLRTLFRPALRRGVRRHQQQNSGHHHRAKKSLVHFFTSKSASRINFCIYQ